MQVSFGNTGSFSFCGSRCSVPSPVQCGADFRMFPCSCNPQVARPGHGGSVVRGALHLWHHSPVKSERVLSCLGGCDGSGCWGSSQCSLGDPAGCGVFCAVADGWLCIPRLHMVRLMLLERLLQNLPQLRNVGGVRAIPYMQVCEEGSEFK